MYVDLATVLQLHLSAAAAFHYRFLVVFFSVKGVTHTSVIGLAIAKYRYTVMQARLCKRCWTLSSLRQLRREGDLRPCCSSSSRHLRCGHNCTDLYVMRRCADCRVLRERFCGRDRALSAAAHGGGGPAALVAAVGWYNGLLTCGSCCVAVTWAAQMKFLVNAFRAASWRFHCSCAAVLRGCGLLAGS
jgi:hypothetical protein